MSRTTYIEVKSVIDTGLTEAEITMLINNANRMIDYTITNSSLSTDQLKDIETWLAAHLIAIGKERQPKEERVYDIWIKFQTVLGTGLHSTSYGQMVLLLDTTKAFLHAQKMKATVDAVSQYRENE